ncbi:metal ABC transporter permease [Shewanella sp. 202IG2-18]|uniref:metal ABC transporter permease n=1 Tax=Parashewanella hymeniacidonis TaxID=2807618 RepID=UPI001961F5C9|nr:metal ABC transporter permease [Parashewanella hymeniacidonis]MBM7071849.1 metal ABC transporter permease [Parashewanella hymeniacidonis]
MFDLLDIILPAFVAGLLVLSTHVVLGCQVLKRGIIFIDLAIAQIAALGAIVAKTHHDFEALPLMQFVMPAVFALFGAALIAWLSKKAPKELEALIGCLYVVSAVAALLLLANDPHGAELLKQIMSGQILWVDWSQLIGPAIIYIMLLMLLMFTPRLLNGRAFYFIFAIVITFSVELVGVYLVFSTLIMPALASQPFKGKKGVAIALGIGLLGYVVGLMVSVTMDYPSGASIVMCLAGFSLISRVGYTFKTKGIY